MRFAVVLYGGVSLAIYINGIVQELLSLVRATAPDEPLGSGEAPNLVLLPAAGLAGAEPTYRKLGQMLSWHESSAPKDINEGTPVRTRFIVDILSGTSAGGINAVFLGKALANEQSLEQLRQIWVSEADMKVLVNDAVSYAHLGLPEQVPPASLLNGRRFYKRVFEALRQMDAAEPRPDGFESRLVEELDCWITATDINGLPLDLRLYDKAVPERRYRNVFHLAYRPEYAVGPNDADDAPNDFTSKDNPFLAYAARCSSSFPFAFEPMELADIDEVVLLPGFEDYRSLTSSSNRWQHFFEDYVLRAKELHPKLDPSVFYGTRAFGDGGYLDNKPFSWATATLSRRRADVPVDRRLLYLEPDPGLTSAEDPLPLERPNAIDNSLAAITKVPRAETIREDLERIAERNGNVARLQRIVRLTDDSILEAEGAPRPIPEIPPDEWRGMSAERLFRERGLQYAVYHRLKVATVLDDLTSLVARGLGLVEDSDETKGLRCLIEAWFRRRYPDRGEGEQSQNEFLLQFDLRYRLRRLNYLQGRIDGLLRGDRSARSLLQADDEWAELVPQLLDETFQAELRRLKVRLNEIFVALRAGGRRLRTVAVDALQDERQELGLSRRSLLGFLSGAADERAAIENAGNTIDRGDLMPKLNVIAQMIAVELRPALLRAASDADDLFFRLAPSLTGVQRQAVESIHQIYDKYENYDAVILPISYGVVEESDIVEVIRCSPQDATWLLDERASGRHKLGGVQFGHFGGSLNVDWRTNDMMWGRLDAAERLIRTLLPVTIDETVAQELVRDAHLAILEQERSRVFPDYESAQGVYDYLHDQFSVDVHLDHARAMSIGRRALSVTNRLLAGLPKQGHPSMLATSVAPVAGAVAGLMALAARPSVRFGVSIGGFVAVGGLLGCGISLNTPWAARIGWMLLVYAILAAALLFFVNSKLGEALGPKVQSTGSGPPAPPPPTPPGQGFPAPGETTQPAANSKASAALAVAFLILIFPLAMLNSDIATVVSWLPGWD